MSKPFVFLHPEGQPHGIFVVAFVAGSLPGFGDADRGCSSDVIAFPFSIERLAVLIFGMFTERKGSVLRLLIQERQYIETKTQSVC